MIDVEVVEDDEDHGPPELQRAALIVRTLGGRDHAAAHVQPAPLRRPTRVHRVAAGPPRRVGRLRRGRDVRTGGGPGGPAAVGGRTPPGRAGGGCAWPRALRRHVRQQPAPHRADGGAAGRPHRDDPGRRRRPARGLPGRVGGRAAAPEGGGPTTRPRAGHSPSSAGT